MSAQYAEYVIACYALFALMLAWGFIAPRLRIARALRAARTGAARPTTTSRQSTQGELKR